jgi:hypothetical protein
MRNQTLSDDANLAVQAWMRGQLSSQQARLTQAMDGSGLTVTVNSTTGIAQNALLLIGSEVVLCSAKTATTFTVTRGALGTAPAAHSSGDVAYELKYKGIAGLFDSNIKDLVRTIMDQSPSGAVATQKAAIATALAAIETAKDGGVS